MTITILPPALTQFFNGSGVPLAGGSVFMYQPNSTTFKTTWQDPGATIPNSNPIILNGAGEAAIWGSGEYLQVVYDSSGNEQYSALTLDPGYAVMATFNGTSTTSVAIGTGSKSFTTQPGLQFFPGGTVNIASNASALNYMNGTVTSYNTSTGALVVNVLTDGGSGTHSDWNIAVSGVQGPAGTVTSISIASANGFAGTSTGGGTPQLTLSTTVTGVLKGNGTAISAATSGTDYIAPNSGSGVVNETMLDLSNVTTANVTTSAHGFAPILPNNALQYLNGIGTYTTPVLQALIGTSATSLALATGSQTFTTQSNLALAAGQFLVIVYTGNSADYFFGQVTSYSGTTLVVNVTQTGGSGTFASWNILASGPQGAAGSGTINSGTANDLAYYASSGTALSALATANSGILVTSSGGVPSIATAIPNGVTATTQSVGDNSTKLATTAFAQNSQTGGFINKFRNPSMDIWQRGTSLTATNGTRAYMADGWTVLATGANAAVAQTNVYSDGTTTSMQITGNTGMTDTYIATRIESYLAGQLLAEQPSGTSTNCTVQFCIYNNTGSTLTPIMSIQHATAQDNWGGAGTDVNGVSLQSITNGSIGLCAYTWTPSSLSGYGLQFYLDFGAALNANTKSLALLYADVRSTPGVSTGLNNTPPLAEFRPIAAELPFNQRYLYITDQVYEPSFYSYGASAGELMGASYRFPVTMRAAPTATTTGTWLTQNTGQPAIASTSTQGYSAISTTTTGGSNYFQPNSSAKITFSAEL